jgi:hypothetical protein
MGIISISISAAALAFAFVEILGVPYWFKGLLNFKPFACQTCMSGWFALALGLLSGTGWIWLLPVMALAMIVNIILNGVVNKL